MRGDVKATVSPNTSIVPVFGATRPDSSLTIVDLPAPFSPSKACTLPAPIDTEMSSSATVAP